MNTSKEKLLELHKWTDVMLTGSAFIAAYFIKWYLLPAPFRGLATNTDYYIILLLILIVWFVSFAVVKPPGNIREKRITRLLLLSTKRVIANVVVLLVFLYLLKIKDVSRIMIGLFIVIDIGLLTASRWCILYLFKLKGPTNLLIAIISTGESASELTDALNSNADADYNILGCLDNRAGNNGKPVEGKVKILGPLDCLEKYLRQNVVDEVIFSIPVHKINEAEPYFNIAQTIGVQIRILPHLNLRHFLASRPEFYDMRFEDFFGNPTLIMKSPHLESMPFLLKELMDYVFALLAMILALPLLAIIAIAIKLVSPGSVLYGQTRCGLYGRKFTMYKFRTMVAGADKMKQELKAMDESDGPAFKIKRDPRIIPYIGRILRKLSLDELPNLINVLRGEMSLVGPRPPEPKEVDQYELWERRRLSMKPGLTCYWQIHPERNRVSFKQWMELDLEYIDNWSLWLDIKIMVRTVIAVLAGYGM